MLWKIRLYYNLFSTYWLTDNKVGSISSSINHRASNFKFQSYPDKKCSLFVLHYWVVFKKNEPSATS